MNVTEELQYYKMLSKRTLALKQKLRKCKERKAFYKRRSAKYAERYETSEHEFSVLSEYLSEVQKVHTEQRDAEEIKNDSQEITCSSQLLSSSDSASKTDDTVPSTEMSRITMSWQAYVDTNLVGSGMVTQAAIIGLDGGIWATSAGWKVTPDEAKKLAGSFKDATAIRSSGLYLAAEKNMVVKADDRSIYGKRTLGGCVAVKTGKCILVGTYNEKVQPGQANTVVEKLGDYLIEQGY